MRYIYDNTIEGLFSAIFMGYKNIEVAEFSPTSNQNSFLSDEIAVITSKEYYNRVKNSLIENFGYEFFKSIKTVLRSKDLERGSAIAKIIKGMYLYGFVYLNGITKEAVKFNQILRNIYDENHRYKGLIRFREIEGEYLYGEFAPENDILDLLIPHFKHRMPKEKFIILDQSRKKCAIYEAGKVSYFDVGEMLIEDDTKDNYFEECWVEFYNSVKIEERNNPKLMQSHMPKKYWKYLPERQH